MVSQKLAYFSVLPQQCCSLPATAVCSGCPSRSRSIWGTHILEQQGPFSYSITSSFLGRIIWMFYFCSQHQACSLLLLLCILRILKPSCNPLFSLSQSSQSSHSFFQTPWMLMRNRIPHDCYHSKHELGAILAIRQCFCLSLSTISITNIYICN